MRIVIAADDFGISHSVNLAIQEAFEKNLISSASIMVNMPAFDEACNWIKLNNKSGMIGVHLNLVEGPSISSEIRSMPSFCNQDGTFNGKFLVRGTRLSRKEDHVVRQEFKAQISKYSECCGAPAYVDSHHHVHTSKLIAPILFGLLMTNKIPAVRLNQNFQVKHLTWTRRIYKALFNLMIYSFGKSYSNRSARLIDFLNQESRNHDGVLELIVHPIKLKHGSLVDAESRLQLNKSVELIGEHNLIKHVDLSFSYRRFFPDI